MPLSPSQIRRLRIGDRVLLSGLIATGRDRLHKFVAEGGRVPLSLKRGALYHCGPVVVRRGTGWSVRAAGPTTSIREEPYMADVIRRLGLAAVIGKGGMGEETRRALRRHGCVYLHAVGGAAQVLADTVTRVAGVYFLDAFGAAEALWLLDVRDFPALVTMDAHGGSLHERVAAVSDAKRKALSAAASSDRKRRAT